MYNTWGIMNCTLPGAVTVPGAVLTVQYLGQCVLYSTWGSVYCIVPGAVTVPGARGQSEKKVKKADVKKADTLKKQTSKKRTCLKS